MDKKGITRAFRRLAALGLAGGMFWCSTQGGVNAATLKDLFDEHYYADLYKDLKEVYGYDREALWNHYVQHGMAEGRPMNELFDVVKYREQYADLDTAFGNDWDAYINHYLTVGAKEGRENGTGNEFNAFDYAARYADVQAACGDDVLALWKHYQTTGAEEGREARSEEVVQEEIEAEREAAEKAEAEATQKPQETPKPGAHTEKVPLKGDCWALEEYDEDGKLIKCTYYNADDSVEYYTEYEYNEAGQELKFTDYGTDGSVLGYAEYEYDAAGNQTKYTYCNADGSVRNCTEYKYNEARQQIKAIYYDTDGSIKYYMEFEYNEAGQQIKRTRCNAAGSISFSEEYNEAGKLIKSTYYNADGSINYCYEYNEAGQQIKRTNYNADGSVKEWTKYEYYETGKAKKYTIYRADGSISSISDFNEAGWQIKYTGYNADGRVSSWTEFERYENGKTKKATTYRAVNGSVMSCDEYYETGKMKKSTSYRVDGSISGCIEYNEAGQQIKSTTVTPIYTDEAALRAGWTVGTGSVQGVNADKGGNTSNKLALTGTTKADYKLDSAASTGHIKLEYEVFNDGVLNTMVIYDSTGAPLINIQGAPSGYINIMPGYQDGAASGADYAVSGQIFEWVGNGKAAWIKVSIDIDLDKSNQDKVLSFTLNFYEPDGDYKGADTKWKFFTAVSAADASQTRDGQFSQNVYTNPRGNHKGGNIVSAGSHANGAATPGITSFNVAGIQLYSTGEGVYYDNMVLTVE